MHTRRNVYELGKKWADPILWYARGVHDMQQRALDDPTGWRFYAAMHGIDQPAWRALGYLSSSDQLPTAAVRKALWNQCQHGSWYFLPWHRGFVLALEANIRAAVVKRGGPADWALPYWNYFKHGQKALPVEFSSPQWPDAGPNPLYIEQRYGPHDDSNVFVDLTSVTLQGMSEPDFTGVGNGGSPGFGGVDTGFSHNGRVHGAIESQPHDMVHVSVGGWAPGPQGAPGLMTTPPTAALDPIFWLHHANIDRLWSSWNGGPPARPNPTARGWLKGPRTTGPGRFAMPMPDGSTWRFTADQVLDLVSLDYDYDNLSPTGQVVPRRAAVQGLAAAAEIGGAVVPSGDNVELLGANDEAVTVRGSATTRVRLDTRRRQAMTAKVTWNAAPARSHVAGAGLPEGLAGEGGEAEVAAETVAGERVAGDRVFLNLENVRGQSDAAAFRVYVGVPAGDDVASHPELLAGSVAPFGLRQASQPDGAQAGQGLTFVLDITQIVARLDADEAVDVDDLPVRIVPVRDRGDASEVSIGRVSIFRQGD